MDGWLSSDLDEQGWTAGIAEDRDAGPSGREGGPSGAGGARESRRAGRRARTDGAGSAGSGEGRPSEGVQAGAGGAREGGQPSGGGEDGGPEAAGSHKRRRTPRSDWQFPLLTNLGMRPERQRLLVIVASVVGVLAGMGGLVAIAGSIGTYAPERRASAAVAGPDATLPQVFRGWRSPKLFDPVADRAKDPRALTEKEVFGQNELAVSKKLRLKLVAKQLDTDCSAALWGQRLVQQVSDAECSQVARGLYASSDGRYVGQYTLLNLKDGQSAGELIESLRTLYRGGWARPLSSAKAAFPAGGYSEAGGYALGHYVGLVWLGRVDGTEPGPRDDFVSLTLALRGAEKAVYRRVVSIAGPSS